MTVSVCFRLYRCGLLRFFFFFAYQPFFELHAFITALCLHAPGKLQVALFTFKQPNANNGKN